MCSFAAVRLCVQTIETLMLAQDPKYYIGGHHPAHANHSQSGGLASPMAASPLPRRDTAKPPGQRWQPPCLFFADEATAPTRNLQMLMCDGLV